MPGQRVKMFYVYTLSQVLHKVNTTVHGETKCKNYC